MGAYLSLSLKGREAGWGWALNRGWALIQFFCLQDGRLFEVGANSRLGAYSNKYGSYFLVFVTTAHAPLITILSFPKVSNNRIYYRAN